MIIESIVLKGEKIPRTTADIRRNNETKKLRIQVDVYQPNAATLNYRIDAASHDEIWKMASRLQADLDGGKGTHSEICDYFEILARFAN